MQNEPSPARDVFLHDWLTYAVCRASGGKWVVSNEPSIKYRQHSNNVVGANSGLKAKLSRFKKLKQGWYRAEILKITKVCSEISNDVVYKELISDLSSNSFFARLNLLKYAYAGRRKLSDAFILCVLLMFGLF